MSREDCENGKSSHWTEMEIRGPIKNLSPDLWTFTHLTSLYLNDNNLQVSAVQGEDLQRWGVGSGGQGCGVSGG